MIGPAVQRLLTAAQVAERLAVSARTVQRLAGAGLLPALRLGVRLLRFDPEAVERWIAAAGAPRPERSSLLTSPRRPGRIPAFRVPGAPERR